VFLGVLWYDYFIDHPLLPPLPRPKMEHTMEKKLAQRFAELAIARKSCKEHGNDEWFAKHGETLHKFVEMLPSGSGFDAGSTFDEDASDDTKLVFHTSFHHMNENGYYDGWTEHKVTAISTFLGLSITVSGRNRNDIKEYISQAFHETLNETAAT
jgi:hypothetical protein